MVLISQTSSIKIPIDPTRWYQLNTTNKGINQLFDGILNQNPSPGHSLVLYNWDAWYPVLKGESIQIDKIRFYDFEGMDRKNPMTIYIIDDQWKRIPIARFAGINYKQWVGPYVDSPNIFLLIKPVNNIRYIVINTSGFYPAEIEFYGKYKSPSPITATKKTTVPVRDYFGTNGFEWSFLKSNGNVINEPVMQLAKAFSGFRHYLDWDRLEKKPGAYTFQPMADGGWYLDLLYQQLKQANITVLACLKTIPKWMENTYPAAQRNNENAPVKFGSNLSLPQSYLDQAKMAFQFAARYGSNKKVPINLLHVNASARWTGDQINTIKIGLDLVKYIECNNEQDRWWKGRDAYQTGREYAANLSAFYDGHKNTMGPGVGVKNADPNMQVLHCGTASNNTDYLRGMIDWCIEFRGYLPNGSVNFCWDIINVHFYSNDSKISQNGNATRGIAPELGGLFEAADLFIKTAHQYCNDMPVWLTEIGYDTKAYHSTQQAISIGKKSPEQTQADWILRTSLLAARAGLSRLFYYEMFDDNSDGGQYGSSGFLNNDKKTRKPAGDFSMQFIEKFGNYQFKENLHHQPEIDRYEWNGQSMYAMWMPTEKGATMQFDWKLPKTNSATIYTPIAGSDFMQSIKVQSILEKFPIKVSETPIFIVPDKN